MSSTALLVMDVQQGIVDRFAADEDYLPRLAAAVEAFPRQADVVRIADWTGSLA